MNNYTITKCTHCSKPIVVNEEGTISTHGESNRTIAMDRISKGESIQSIAKDFCGYCGGLMPCGCGNPRPQDGLPSA